MFPILIMKQRKTVSLLESKLLISIQAGYIALLFDWVVKFISELVQNVIIKKLKYFFSTTEHFASANRQ